MVSGNGASGIRLDAANGTSPQGILIEGNKVGTNSAGTAAIPNQISGIRLFQANDTTIGGTVAGAGNLISGNTVDGIQVQNTSSGTVIQGNIIGLIGGGTSVLPNTNYGIELLFGATGTVIDGGNVISGNAFQGISLGNSSLDSLVQGNLIGTDPTGKIGLGNQEDGIGISISSNNTIGGTAPGQGNLISGNGFKNGNPNGSGIIDNLGASDLIEGNFIGTTAGASGALPNGQYGVFILGGNGPNGSSNDTIGGSVSGAGNVISGNTQDGVYIQDAAASNVLIEGNDIGTNPAGAVLGNGGNGVDLFASQNTVGGTAAAAGNVIAYNTGANALNSGNGVVLVLNSNEDEILSNSIHDNTSLGINFGTSKIPVPNTPWPSGPNLPAPNNYQNHPVLSSAVSSGGTTTIQGTLNAAASTQFLVQFFDSPSPGPSGYVDGEKYLGSEYVTTDGNYNATINATLLNTTVPGGSYVTATATDPAGNTSEFSSYVQTKVVADLGITGQAGDHRPRR